MPLIPEEKPSFPTATPQIASGLAPEPPQEAPSWSELNRAAFELESPIYAAVDLLSRKPIPPKEGYLVANDPQIEPYLENYQSSFVGSQSPEETAEIISRITAEEKNRKIYASGGMAGVALGMAYGVFDPTLLLPGGIYLKGARGTRALQSAVGAGMVAGGAVAGQEALLQASQEGRPIEESAMAIGGATILGGILGGAIGGLSRQQADELAGKLLAPKLVVQPGGTPIPNAAGLSADVVIESPGQLKHGIGVDTLSNIGPVTRQLTQDTYESASQTMAMLSDAGATMEKNVRGVPTTPGGTIENRIKTRYGGLAQGINRLDELYASYWYDGAAPKFAAGMRSRIGSEWARWTGSTGGRLTAKEFRIEAGKAARMLDEHPVPQVAAAAKIMRESVFDPLWDAAKRSGLVDEEELGELVGAQSYLSRIYLTDKIAAQRDKFIEVLTKNSERKMQENFQRGLERLMQGKAITKQQIADLKLDPIERAAQIELLNYEKTLLEAGSPELEKVLDAINELQQAARAAPDSIPSLVVDGKVVVGDPAKTKKGLLAEARKLRDEAGEDLAAYRKQKAELNRRLKSLKFGDMPARWAATMSRLEATEENMLKSLQRVAKAGQKIQRELDNLTDDKLDDALTSLRDQFEKLAKSFDLSEQRMAKAMEDPDGDAIGKLLIEETRQLGLSKRMSDLALKIGAGEDLPRAQIREMVERSIDDLISNVNRLNSGRAKKVQMLREKAAKQDPANVAKKQTELEAKMVSRETAFRSQWSKEGDVDLDAGKGTFTARAREISNEVTDAILGNNAMRLAGFDLKNQGKRGSELARTLDIPDEEIADWLEADIERVARIYTSSLAPDVEIATKFGGEVDPMRPPGADGIGGSAYMRLLDEFRMKAEKNRAEITKANPKATPEQIDKAVEKQNTKLQRDFENSVRDLQAVLGRLRRTYALPENPRGMGHRLARTAIALNYLRFMGSVTVSSLPDLARPIMRYGLAKTFRHGFIPLVTNLKALKMNAREVRLAGTALDMTLDTRSQALGDLWMDYQRGTKLERGLEYATNRFGLVSLMAPWNAGMKQLSGVIAIQDLLTAAERLRLGKATNREIEVLSANGISPELAGRIMDQLEGGGGAKVNGQWFPNTEDWADTDALEAFRAAIVREVDNMIITPGVERPLWQSKLMGSADLGKMLGQFRSFSTSSVSRMLIAGVQQRDLAMVNGLVASMAMGALAYYIYAMSTGGRAQKEMEEATPEKWAAEAIERSGIITVLSDFNRIAEATPMRGISRFTGEQLSRQQPTDVFGAALGPTADLASRMVRGVGGVLSGSPTRGDIHHLRVGIVGGQNLFYLRRVFDAIEQAIGDKFDLPERRGQK